MCTARDFLGSLDHLALRVTCRSTHTHYAFKVYLLQAPIPSVPLLQAFTKAHNCLRKTGLEKPQPLPATRLTPLGQAGVARLVALWSLDIMIEIIQTIDIDYLADELNDAIAPARLNLPTKLTLHRHKMWTWWTSCPPCWMNSTQGCHAVRCLKCWQSFQATSHLLPRRVEGLIQEICLPPPPGLCSSHEFLHPDWTCLSCNPEI